MASRRFPDSGTRYVQNKHGDRESSGVITYYFDPAGQFLAEVYAERGTDTPDPSDALDGSTTHLDAFGRQVDFRGPLDGTDELWASVNGGPLFRVLAAPEPRLRALESLLPGGASEAATAQDLAEVAAGKVDKGSLALNVASVIAPGTSDVAGYASIQAALTGIGSTEKDLLITSPVTLPSNVTIPANVCLRITRTGSIALAGFTLTINGRLDADRSTVFTGAGSVVFGPASNDRVYPEWWGAKGNGSVDSGPAITKAVAAVKTNGGTVSLAAGTYLIQTTIDMSNIQPQAFHYNSARSVTLEGAGSRQTYLTGGESGFGFIEIVGSNFLTLRGMCMVTSGGTKQYGILAGRKVGDASSGEHVFEDLFIYGAFSLAAFFVLCCEMSIYDRVKVYTTTGRGFALTRDNTPNYGAVAKYTQLSTTIPIPGGNGVNRMLSCAALSISPNATDYPLIIEYPQTFTCDNMYIFTLHQTAQIWVSKLAHNMTFTSLHQECGDVQPWGVYFNGDNAAPSLPQFRDITFLGCGMFGVYAEDGTGIAGLTIRARFRGSQVAQPYQVDVASLYDSAVHCDGHLASVTGITAPAYRVRTAAEGNDWGTATPEQITVPNYALERVTTFDALHKAPQYGPRALVANNFYRSEGAVPQAIVQTAGNAYAVPVWVPVSGTVVRMAVHVSAAAASSSIVLGMYASQASADRPGALLASYGSVDSSTTGFKELTISQPLTRGWYWLSCLFLGGNPGVYVNTAGHPLISSPSPTLSQALNGVVITGASELPATWPSFNGTGFCPILAFRL